MDRRSGGDGAKWTAVLLVALLLALNTLILTLPRLGPFAGLEWNWQGKTLDLIWVLAAIALLHPALRREIGWSWRIPPGTVPVLAINIAILALAGFLLMPAGTLTMERVLFDIGWPNLVEEIVFRGFMLALLDRVFTRRWAFGGTVLGWGAVLTAVLFGLVHAVQPAPDGGLGLDPAAFAITAAAGFVFAWLRTLTGSLWPAFLAHCAPEIGVLAALALGR